MKKYLSLQALLLLLIIDIHCGGQTLNDIEANRILLPNGWQLTPAGRSITLGDFPLNIAVSPDRKLAAVTNNGQSTQSVQLIDLKKGMITDTVIIGKSWLGLAFSADGKSLYASGGNDNIIIRYAVQKKKLINADTIVLGKPWPELISVAGIALDESKNRLYAVTQENNSLYVVDLRSKQVISQHPLGGEGYTCVLSPDRKTLYSSCWGCDRIVVFDTDRNRITGEIAVGDNPNDMCLTRNGRYLFVANANDNSVSVIDTFQNKVIETLNAALYPGSPAGSSTNGVALSDDERTLYIANADNNCLAVFNVAAPGKSKSEGFIPTGWYPTCVRVAGDKILVTNGKGMTSMANPYGPNPARRGDEVIYRSGSREHKIKVQYIAGLFMGAFSMIDKPDEKLMGLYSKAVYDNTPYVKDKE
ncbi:MAG: YncE family protein, partial [Bacteroidales bacterium]